MTSSPRQVDLNELPEPGYVDTAAALDELFEELKDVDEVAVDTEADSFYSYREKVCLIQVSANGKDWLVDPLADYSIDKIGELLADASKCKLFHDGEYDFLLFQREYGFVVENIYDTRAAEALLGNEAPGLGTVLADRFGLELDKSLQRSDWGKRPLTEKQVSYARLDTRFLSELRSAQVPELERRGLLPVLEGEHHRLEAIRTSWPEFNPEGWGKLKGARALSPEDRCAARELFILRDAIARERDQACFRILNNQAVVEIARAQPENEKQLADVPGVSWGIVRKIGDQLLDALDRAEEKDPITEMPPKPRKEGDVQLDEAGAELHERIKNWRRQEAARVGYDASLVLHRIPMGRIALSKPTSVEAVAGIEGVQSWQAETHGEVLAATVRDFNADLASGRWKPGRRRRRQR
jgi:ribonuclease D